MAHFIDFENIVFSSLSSEMHTNRLDAYKLPYRLDAYKSYKFNIFPVGCKLNYLHDILRPLHGCILLILPSEVPYKNTLLAFMFYF